MSLFIMAGIIGMSEVILIIVVLLVFFGGRKLPELARGLGQGIKEFKKSMTDDETQKKEENKAEK